MKIQENLHANACYHKKEKWYNKYQFPLIPSFTVKKADEHNTKWFEFRWLIFHFWSLDSVRFEIALTIDTHWGIGFTFLLPYLRGVIAIPCPYKFAVLIDRISSRKVRQKKLKL